jgi:hypothetical protein
MGKHFGIPLKNLKNKPEISETADNSLRTVRGCSSYYCPFNHSTWNLFRSHEPVPLTFAMPRRWHQLDPDLDIQLVL